MMKHGASSSQEEDSMYMRDPFGPNVGLRQRTDSWRRMSGEEVKEDKDCKPPAPAATLPQSKSPEGKVRAMAKVPPPRRRRRNSTGTIYIDSTLSKQDDQHTMDCIGVVIRAHMQDAAKQNIVPKKEYDTFNDILEGKADSKDTGSQKVCN
jgi:hypothetical protein